MNRRGLDISSKNYEEKNSIEIRGPVCPEFIASFIVGIAGKTLERVFNSIITLLASNSFFPRKIKALLDASDIESTQKCKGCGKVSKEKALEHRRRKGRIKKNKSHVIRFQDMGGLGPNQRSPACYALCHH